MVSIRPSTLPSLIVLLCCLGVALLADTASVRGHIVDPAGLALPGVTVTLRPANADAPVATTTTDGDGNYEISGVAPGQYDVVASLDSFDTTTRRAVVVSADAVTVDLQLRLAALTQVVTVTAAAPADVLGTPEPNAPVSVTRAVMDVAMLPNSQFDDVLPLMPNVVRGPDGLISVAGARASAGGLYVNGVNASDPIGGGSGVMLPLEAVDAMHVYAGGAPAEFGGASGGVTAVQTRSGSDRFRMSLDSFFPRLLYSERGVSGVAFWDPNLGLGGPIVKGRLTYQQALSYRYDRNTFTTLAGPDQNVFDALLSWTQVDARVSDAQRLRVSVGADPRETDRAGITAFTPGAVTPRVAQGGWNAGIADAITAKRMLIDLRASVLDTRGIVSPQGAAPYVMTHDVVDGNYFDSQNRNAARVDAAARLTWSARDGQTITVGASAAHAGLDQQVAGSTITMLRSDATIARQIAFGPAAAGHVSLDTVSLFAQDRWTARPWLTIDGGVRYDRTSASSTPAVAPRIGWTLGGASARTTVSGSLGVFADTLPLEALAFPLLPVRHITTASVDGTPAAETTVDNVLASGLQVPQAVRWDVEMNRRAGIWQMRLRYEERRGRHELVIDPAPGPTSDVEGQGTFGGIPLVSDTLSSDGASRSRSLETTTGLRTAGGAEFYVSYVRASASGDQNSLDALEGLLRVPFVQPNQTGPLPVDVPHRVLAWGLFHLPSSVTIAPFLDARSGFPFTAVTDDWLVAGAAGAHRLPWTASLDLSATRVMGLPHHLPDARVGVKLYNVISVHTERDVQRDIERADFGTAYDPVPRDFSIVFEFLWGRH